MTNDIYFYCITALLPLSALMLVLQKNPYHALVVRGILGAIAALVYAVFGAADVALTEALVGTMLAITLYAVAVRSSLMMRLGIVDVTERDPDNRAITPSRAAIDLNEPQFQSMLATVRDRLTPYHIRLEIVPYVSLQALEHALVEKEIHAVCLPYGCDSVTRSAIAEPHGVPAYHLRVRVQRLYEIVQSGGISEATLQWAASPAKPTTIGTEPNTQEVPS